MNSGEVYELVVDVACLNGVLHTGDVFQVLFIGKNDDVQVFRYGDLKTLVVPLTFLLQGAMLISYVPLSDNHPLRQKPPSLPMGHGSPLSPSPNILNAESNNPIFSSLFALNFV